MNSDGEPEAAAIGPQPGESPKQRVDRELREMLEEIRVALPGVELLLGFLLILPFSERFETIAGYLRAIHVACFVMTAAAVALFVAPAAYHRLGFRTIDKERMVIRTNRQIIAGMGLLALAIATAAYLVAAVVLDSWWAAAITAAVLGGFALLWFVLPARECVRSRRAQCDLYQQEMSTKPVLQVQQASP